MEIIKYETEKLTASPYLSLYYIYEEKEKLSHIYVVHVCKCTSIIAVAHIILNMKCKLSWVWLYTVEAHTHSTIII